MDKQTDERTIQFLDAPADLSGRGMESMLVIYGELLICKLRNIDINCISCSILLSLNMCRKFVTNSKVK